MVDPAPGPSSLLQRRRAEIGVAVIGVVLVLLLWLGGRGGDGGDDAAVPRPTTTAAPGPTSTDPAASGEGGSAVPEELGGQDVTEGGTAAARAVLQLSDLPQGWEGRAGASDEAELCPGQDPLSAGETTGRARAAFRSGTSFIVGLVADFADPAAAQAFLEAARTAFRSCDGYVVEPVAGVGDEATLGRRSADRPDLTADTRVYLARVGGRVAAVSGVSFEGVDDALLRRLLRVEVDRL